MQATIQEKRLQNMIPPNDPRLDFYAQRAAGQVDQLCAKWRVPKEVGQDIVKLALFDIILYIGEIIHMKEASVVLYLHPLDDSGSMQFEEDGERIKDLKLILSRVAYAASLFDDDGIQVRFMNWIPNPQQQSMLDSIKSEDQVEQLVASVPFKGLTPMGTQLKAKVVDPLVIGPARAGRLRKPILIITVTDGQPAGEAKGTLAETVRYTGMELSRMPQYGRGAVSFQFAQVGNDQEARKFLAKLDEEPGIGDMIDCTSSKAYC